jgi:hypothetical protein
VVEVVTVEMGLRSPGSRAALLPAMVVRVMVVTEVTMEVTVEESAGRRSSSRVLSARELQEGQKL